MNKALLFLCGLSIFFLNFTFPSQINGAPPFEYKSSNDSYYINELGLESQEILALETHLEYFDQSIANAKEAYRNNPKLLEMELSILNGLRKSGIRQLLGSQRAEILIANLKKQERGIAAKFLVPREIIHLER